MSDLHERHVAGHYDECNKCGRNFKTYPVDLHHECFVASTPKQTCPSNVLGPISPVSSGHSEKSRVSFKSDLCDKLSNIHEDCITDDEIEEWKELCKRRSDYRCRVECDNRCDPCCVDKKRGSTCVRLPCIVLIILLLLLLLLTLLPLFWRIGYYNRQRRKQQDEEEKKERCRNNCRFHLVQTVPEESWCHNRDLNETYHTWIRLIKNAAHTIDIATTHWSLRRYPTVWNNISWQGEDIFNNLLFAGAIKGVRIRIVENPASYEASALSLAGAAQVKRITLTGELAKGHLEANFMITDRKHFYIGSAEMDCRSLTEITKEIHFYGATDDHEFSQNTQTDKGYLLLRDKNGYLNIIFRCSNQESKPSRYLIISDYFIETLQHVEMGVLGVDCSCMAEDLEKIFEIYWNIGYFMNTPKSDWPKNVTTEINREHPFKMYNDVGRFEIGGCYISSSPPPLTANYRSDSSDTIVEIIESAQHFVYIALMEFEPMENHPSRRRWWGKITTAIRRAAIDHKVQVKMMISEGPYNFRRETLYDLLSLHILGVTNERIDIKVRNFKVPDRARVYYRTWVGYPPHWPGHHPWDPWEWHYWEWPKRVAHHRYCVTEKEAYIGTTDWVGDDFVDTLGVGFIFQSNRHFARDHDIKLDLKRTFEKLWHSSCTGFFRFREGW